MLARGCACVVESRAVEHGQSAAAGCHYGAMTMLLGGDEPAAGPWRVEPLERVADRLSGDASRTGSAGPRVVAVDGRSSSGKTTIAAHLARVITGAWTVHTDDIAWWHSFFGWTDLLVSGVLEPLRGGRTVAYRPPAWDARNRPGAIEVPGDATVLILEGVGAGRRELAHLVDAVVWVQSDLRAIKRRNQARVAAGEITPSVFAQWMEQEWVFIADQRPWERALTVATGTPELPYDPRTEIVVAAPDWAD